MSNELPPYACGATPGFVKLLHDLRASIAITTYQAGKVIFLSARNETELIQFPRAFKKPMGIAISPQRLAIAKQDEVILYANSPGQAKRYPKKPNVYDTLYIPRAKFYTGELDIHDLHFSGKARRSQRLPCGGHHEMLPAFCVYPLRWRHRHLPRPLL